MKNRITIDLLNDLKPVHAPEHLWAQIQKKMDAKMENSISIIWVRSIAAVFILLFTVEYSIFSLSDTECNNEKQSLVTIPNNSLYNE